MRVVVVCARKAGVRALTWRSRSATAVAEVGVPTNRHTAGQTREEGIVEARTHTHAHCGRQCDVEGWEGGREGEREVGGGGGGG